MMQLKNVAYYVKDRIETKKVNPLDYITTENMIPNKGGISENKNLPIVSRVIKYNIGDVLVSNIRPYFKKIWYANKFGGCSDDVIVFRTINADEFYPKFLYYVLSQDSFFDFMMAGSNGTKMPRGNKKTIPNFIVPNYNIVKQTKIANILSAYDDLIENNHKQIKLLEETAQRLYKEWFVDFRFPGYENTEFVDDLPKGWIQGYLGEIAEFKRGKTITKAQVHEGNVPVVAGGLEPAYYHNKANTVAPVITVSGSGANAGFSRLYNIEVFASDCSFADSETTPYLFFVYAFLKENKALLDTLQKGSAQPHVYAKDINLLKLYIPTKDRLKEYCSIVSPYYGKIKGLEEQIKILAEARDRLLPKLMSGEIEV